MGRRKGSRAAVMNGSADETVGRLKSRDLKKNKSGKLVSKKQSANGKKNYEHIKGWTNSVKKARKMLGIKGFQAVKKGSRLYNTAKEIHAAGGA